MMHLCHASGCSVKTPSAVKTLVSRAAPQFCSTCPGASSSSCSSCRRLLALPRGVLCATSFRENRSLSSRKQQCFIMSGMLFGIAKIAKNGIRGLRHLFTNGVSRRCQRSAVSSSSLVRIFARMSLGTCLPFSERRMQQSKVSSLAEAASFSSIG